MIQFTKEVDTKGDVRILCLRPYPNHPKGCPNFGKKDTCPPKSLPLTEVYDITKGFWVVWVEFDFAGHCQKMRRLHPTWSQRQVECCLYWQGTVNKMLRKEVGCVDEPPETWAVTYCPEGMGVNVTATMKNIGVELEWPPRNIIRKVALIGRIKV